MSDKIHAQDLALSVPDATLFEQDLSLLGLRGLLTIQTIIYIVFEIFFPAAVTYSTNSEVDGTRWQLILRHSLSVFLWNPSLIRAGLIILSARTLSLPFLHRPSRAKLADCLIRRPIRLLIPLSIALAIATAITHISQNDFILRFKELTNNNVLPTPYRLPSTLTYFNALYNVFWTVRSYPTQAASKAFYNNSLWTISVIYTQSYTVYLAAAIIPYTRNRWRVRAWMLFILTAWWVQSWAWFSISGLLLADAVTHMQLRDCLDKGITITLGRASRGWRIRLPGWLFGVCLVLSGGVLEYFWKDWRPNYSRGQKSEVAQSQARDDDFLLIMGVMILLESLPRLRWIMGNKVFVALGKRALSIYLVGSIVMNTVALDICLRLVRDKGLSYAAAFGSSIIVSLLVMLLLAEAYYRLIEIPTAWLGRLKFPEIVLNLISLAIGPFVAMYLSVPQENFTSQIGIPVF